MVLQKDQWLLEASIVGRSCLSQAPHELRQGAWCSCGVPQVFWNRPIACGHRLARSESVARAWRRSAQGDALEDDAVVLAAVASDGEAFRLAPETRRRDGEVKA